MVCAVQVLLFVHLLFICSSDQIIDRNIEKIRDSKQDFQFGLARHQLVVLIGLFGHVAVNGSLALSVLHCFKRLARISFMFDHLQLFL